MMNGIGRVELLLASLCLAIGVAVCGFFVSKTLLNAKVGINTAEVKGLAERRVEADRANWTIQYTVSGGAATDVAKLYDRSSSDQERIIALLLESGLDRAEIAPGVIDYQKKEFRDEHQKLVEERHVLSGSIDVETGKVRLIPEVRAKLNKLIAQGIDMQNNPPAYHFTKLNEIKPAMVKEATMNARIAANEFAADAGVKVGGIRDAQQGGFIIQDVGQEFGDTARIEKDVRLVTTITFYLTD